MERICTSVFFKEPSSIAVALRARTILESLKNTLMQIKLKVNLINCTNSTVVKLVFKVIVSCENSNVLCYVWKQISCCFGHMFIQNHFNESFKWWQQDAKYFTENVWRAREETRPFLEWEIISNWRYRKDRYWTFKHDALELRCWELMDI